MTDMGIWIPVVTAGIAGIVSIFGVVFNFFITKMQAKTSELKTKDGKRREQRQIVKLAEREKQEKLELAMLANNALTAQIASHIVNGNHIGEVDKKRQKALKANTELQEAIEKLKDAYEEYTRASTEEC